MDLYRYTQFSAAAARHVVRCMRGSCSERNGHIRGVASKGKNARLITSNGSIDIQMGGEMGQYIYICRYKDV